MEIILDRLPRMWNTERIIKIKDLKLALKELEPMVRWWDKHWRLWLINWNNLEKKTDTIPIEGWWKFNLRYREAWANWLLCITLRHACNLDLTFGTYKNTDWILIDKVSDEFVITEHVAAMNFTEQDKSKTVEEKVIFAINKKIDRGIAYANEKFLIVFFEGEGKLYPNKIAKALKNKHHFKWVYCIWLVSWDNNGYTYSVSQLLWDSAPTYTVEINSDFTGRIVKRFQ